MSCDLLRDNGNVVAIACTARGRPKRCRCGALATLLCDAPMGGGRTCDAPICSRCTMKVGADRDRCPDHQPRAA